MLAAIVCGALLGHVEPDIAVKMKPLGDWFISAARILVVPVVFCTVTLGVAGLGRGGKTGRFGLKVLIYFEAVSVLALVFGMLVAWLLEPGSGYPLNAASIMEAAPRLPAPQPLGQRLADAVRGSVILQVLGVAILAGTALAALGKRGDNMLMLVERGLAPLFRLVALVMKLAPAAAFGAIAYTVGQHGIASVGPLVRLLLLLYGTTALFVLVVLGGIARLSGFRILPLIRAIKEELLLVFGTASSVAAMPALIEKLQKMGCDKSLVGVVVPASYSFNLCGTNIYLGMSVVFLAQAFQVDPGFWGYAGILGVAMLTSKSATGIAGSAFLALAATIEAVPALPAASLLLIVGIERLLKCRTVGNVIGYAAGCMAIAAWSGKLDRRLADPASHAERK